MVLMRGGYRRIGNRMDHRHAVQLVGEGVLERHVDVNGVASGWVSIPFCTTWPNGGHDDRVPGWFGLALEL